MLLNAQLNSLIATPQNLHAWSVQNLNTRSILIMQAWGVRCWIILSITFSFKITSKFKAAFCKFCIPKKKIAAQFQNYTKMMLTCKLLQRWRRRRQLHPRDSTDLGNTNRNEVSNPCPVSAQQTIGYSVSTMSEESKQNFVHLWLKQYRPTT